MHIFEQILLFKSIIPTSRNIAAIFPTIIVYERRLRYIVHVRICMFEPLELLSCKTSIKILWMDVYLITKFDENMS